MKIVKIAADKEFIRLELDEQTAGEALVRLSLPVCRVSKGEEKAQIKDGTLFVPRFKDGYDRLYLRYDVNVQGTDVCGVKYVTDLEGIAEWNYAYPQPETKKALECTPEDAKILGVRQSMTNINLPAIMTLKEGEDTIPYQHNGKTYYFIKSRVEAMDQRYRTLYENGVMMTAILLNAPRLFDSTREKELLDRVIHPGYDWEQENAYISAFNMRTEEGQDYFRAFVEFLAERYSREDAKYGRICGMVLSNEVDSQYIWTNCGEMTAQEFACEYTAVMRSAWQAASKHYKDFRVYMSLDHFWTLCMEAGKQPLRFYPSKDLVDYVNQYSKEEGDFNWNIAHHPYPEDLRYPDFYNDRSPEFHFETPRITFKNIEMLPAYLSQEHMLYRGRERRIILSEQGFNSRGTAFSEKQGAAAYCLAYQKVKKLPTIDLITHHAYIDDPHEFGLNLGVRRYNEDGTPGEPKPIYYVLKDMDTDKEEERIREARAFIGEELYDQLMNPEIILGVPDRSKESEFGAKEENE